MTGSDANGMRSLFNSIAPSYDSLNHIMSLGIDRIWRRRAIGHIVDKNRSQQILDVACGTGDFSIAIGRKMHPESTITGVDIAEGMLVIMAEKVSAAGLEKQISTEIGDCCKMRFDDGSFDRVTIAFGIRNFSHREDALREILRVLKPGGRLVILELSMPANPVIRWGYKLYFTKVMPSIGGLISGNKPAYQYLPASVLKFPGKEEWMATMEGCGFRNVTHQAFSAGICRMYIGEK